MSECLIVDVPEPVFMEPWHGHVFALTVHLNESGRFTWVDWVARFAKTLARHGLDKDLDGGEDYFQAWLETLEVILEDSGTAQPSDVEQTRADWERAYLSTPHGEPVKLER